MTLRTKAVNSTAAPYLFLSFIRSKPVTNRYCLYWFSFSYASNKTLILYHRMPKHIKFQKPRGRLSTCLFDQPAVQIKGKRLHQSLFNVSLILLVGQNRLFYSVLWDAGNSWWAFITIPFMGNIKINWKVYQSWGWLLNYSLKWPKPEKKSNKFSHLRSRS